MSNENKWLNHNGRRTKQGSGGGSGSGCTYTSSSPSNVEVGGIPAGTSFTNEPCENVLEQLLHKYLLPAFTSFSISGAGTLEVGDTLGANQTATWSTSNSGNVQPNTINIDDVTQGTNLVTGSANDGSEVLTQSAITHSAPTTHTWKITGTNTHSGTFTRNYSKHWYFRMYYGESALTTLTESDIKNLRANLLTNTFARTYALQSGATYKYVVYPESFGTATTFTDVDTGFAVAMEAPYLVSVTNAFGITENYRVHRTTNIINGNLNMAVS